MLRIVNVIYPHLFIRRRLMKVVLGFSCGHRGKDPGLSNEAMAKVIQQLAPDIISVQVQIGQALRTLGVAPNHEVSVHQKHGRYLDTEEVARQMLAFLHGCGMHDKDISVVAHPIHLPRCVSILRKIGVRSLVSAIYATIPCDPQSHHFWTRSPILIRAHEILGVPIYLARGYYRTA